MISKSLTSGVEHRCAAIYWFIIGHLLSAVIAAVLPFSVISYVFIYYYLSRHSDTQSIIQNMRNISCL